MNIELNQEQLQDICKGYVVNERLGFPVTLTAREESGKLVVEKVNVPTSDDQNFDSFRYFVGSGLMGKVTGNIIYEGERAHLTLTTHDGKSHQRTIH